jgi:rRNA-processing protein FCF1
MFEAGRMRFLVLLKDSRFLIVECCYEDIYKLAKERDAGICGMYNTQSEAEKFIAQAYSPDRAVRPLNRPSFP